MSKILIVEDEESIADLEKDYLELSGFEVEIENQGDTGLVRAVKEDFDLLILDLMLPEVDGFEICRRIRQVKNTPILMVSAKKEDIDKIRGLGLGADDYITKPFRLRELLARVKAVLRRGQSLATNMLQVGPLRLYPDQAKVYRQEEELFLTAMEYRLLLAFMRHPGQVLTRSRLMEALWDVDGAFVEDNTLSVYVRRLREKIGDTDAAQPLIATVRGLGYRMEG